VRLLLIVERRGNQKIMTIAFEKVTKNDKVLLMFLKFYD